MCEEGSYFVAFYSDGEAAYPLCIGKHEAETLAHGRYIADEEQHMGSYFVSVKRVPFFYTSKSEGDDD